MKRIFAVIAVLFMAVFVSASLEGALELTWANSELLEDNTYDAGEVQVAVDGSVAVAVWKQYDSSGWGRIYSNYSNDGGATWHNDQILEDNTGRHAYAPQVAVSGSNVVAVWYQWDGVTYNIYSNYSTNGGATWHSDLLVEIDAGSAMVPQVAIDGSNVVAVWRQLDPTYNSIYAAFSTNGGASWNSAGSIENANRSAESPKVAMDGSNVVSVWYQYDASSDYRIYSNYSTNGGQTWVGDQQVESNPYQGEYQKVAINGSNAVVVWRQEDGTNYGIYSSYSTDGGANWSPDQLIEDNPGQASNPDVAMSPTTAVVVWYQDDGTTYRVYSSYSTDGGANWSPDEIVDTNSGRFANNPDVAISGDIPVAVWYQWDGSHTRVYSSYAEFVNVPAGGGGCFIATAAFGSPYERHVKTLTEFRDNHLLTNRPGMAFVRWYYRHSPVFADYIRRRQAARAFVRTLLRPLAWLVSLW